MIEKNESNVGIERSREVGCGLFNLRILRETIQPVRTSRDLSTFVVS